MKDEQETKSKPPIHHQALEGTRKVDIVIDDEKKIDEGKGISSPFESKRGSTTEIPLHNKSISISKEDDHLPQEESTDLWSNPKGLADLMISKLLALLTTVNDSMNKVKGYWNLKKEIGRAVQQECRDRSRMPSSA
eukprot:TRINITY_DN11376_c0_g2_i2.p1 TRINITY_DN11376_c0_g2~~TRINITY_DN11376_c0_g2_i2.p1  ORF type:complete len:136 (+),score=26.42 TRINITY_DN11376_c0_g2_i2:108-515(+)